MLGVYAYTSSLFTFLALLCVVLANISNVNLVDVDIKARSKARISASSITISPASHPGKEKVPD